jgi:hypothetical protein
MALNTPAILHAPRRNGLERKVIMILAHMFGLRGHLFGSDLLFFLIVLAFVVIVVTWPSKTEPK